MWCEQERAIKEDLGASEQTNEELCLTEADAAKERIKEAENQVLGTVTEEMRRIESVRSCAAGGPYTLKVPLKMARLANLCVPTLLSGGEHACLKPFRIFATCPRAHERTF